MLAANAAGAALTGLYAGTLEHNGQNSYMALRLHADTDTTRALSISLTALDVWDLPIGRAVLAGDSLRLGAWVIRASSDGNALTGSLPDFLVPVHHISFRLDRAESLARATRPAPEPQDAGPVWVLDTGAPVWAGVTVDNGRIYVGNDSGVVAIDAATGAELWRRKTPAPVRAQPVPHRGFLLVHCDDGVLYHLDTTNGRVTERQLLSSKRVERVPPGKPGSRYDHYTSAPVVANDTTCVGAGNNVVALAPDGTRLWTVTTGDRVSATPAVHGGAVYAGSFDGIVYAIDATTGELVWRYDTGAPVTSTPAVHDGLVVVGSRSYDILALDVETGEPAWRYYLWFSWVESSATIRDGVAYVGSSDAQLLTALDLDSGTPRWQTDTGGSAWARPAVTDDAVCIGTVGVAGYFVPHDGVFLCVDRDSGKPRWRFVAGRRDGATLWGFASSPTVWKNRVIVGGLDGRVYAFDPSAR